MKLLSPETNVSRPITDRVKESLFSVLYKYDLPLRLLGEDKSRGKIVADLFCGVGSLGLEALSRGAEFVTFVEKDPKIIVTLKKNIEKAGFAGESKVIRADAFKIGAPADVQKYDLIFVDPPYSTTRETIPHLSRPGHRRNPAPIRTTLKTVPHPFATPSWSEIPSDDKTNRCGTPLSKLLVLLSEQSAVGGIVVVRTEKRTELLEHYGRFEVIERRQWGTMAVTILKKKKIVNE
jgi:16S rRNA (guanine966-N2)-methyltransferase